MPDKPAKLLHELFGAAGLVDEIDSSGRDRRRHPFDALSPGEEGDRQRGPTGAQGAQQIETGHVRQGPIDQRKLGLDAGLHRRQQGGAIGKTEDGKPVILELGPQGLAIEFIVVDKDDWGLHGPAGSEARVRS